jgi:cell division protein FtsL
MAAASAPRRAPAPNRSPDAGRPRLQVVGPPSRRRAPWSVRPTLLVAAALVLGSLLIVAAAQAYMTQEQVRLTQVQARLATQVGEHHDLELRVAQLSNPSHIVSAAQHQGLTVPTQVTDLTPVSIPATVTTHPTATTSAASHPSTKASAPAHRDARNRAPGAGGT